MANTSFLALRAFETVSQYNAREAVYFQFLYFNEL